MSRTIRTCFAIVILLCAQSMHAAEKNASKYLSEKVTILGAVKQKLELKPEDLRKFPPHQLGDLAVICQSGANKGKLENIKGVLLRDILTKAEIVAPGHNDVKKMAIIARATDNYQVVFSWSEVFNSSLGDGVMVFYEKDGKPLGDAEGRIALISSKDIRTGPRHVKWLQSVEVKKIVE